MARLSGGTLTSDHVALGESDACARWIDVRRHQVVLVVAGVSIAGEGVMSSRGGPGALAVGLVVIAAAAPTVDGPTWGEQLLRGLLFFLRSRWSVVTVLQWGQDVTLWARSGVAFRAYELTHRGRLDLSGRDVAAAEALAVLVDAASAANADQHVSQHVVHRHGRVATLLALPVGTPAPEGWRHGSELAREVLVAGEESTSINFLERFTYLRSADQLVRVYRVRDFSAVAPTRALLERVLRSAPWVDLAVHAHVVRGSRAQRLAARAVHRVSSDAVTSRAAGFRRTARFSRNFERLAQREALVASGRALLRVGVYVVVRARSLQELGERSAALRSGAHDAGLRLERGRGVQAQWYRSHLPGGPGW